MNQVTHFLWVATFFVHHLYTYFLLMNNLKDFSLQAKQQEILSATLFLDDLK